MDFTTANAHTVHAATGFRMAQQTGVVPTALDVSDSNGPIWAIMAVILQSGRTPVAFNPDVPATYKDFLYAIFDLTRPLNGVYETYDKDFDPNVAWPWTTWTRGVPGAYSRNGDLAMPGLDVGGVTGGANSVALTVGQLPPHAVTGVLRKAETGGPHWVTTGRAAGDSDNSALGNNLSDQSDTVGNGDPVSLTPFFEITFKWRRTS